MKKLLFIFVAVMSLVVYSTSIYADGAVRVYKNGKYTVFPANEVDSVVFVPYSGEEGDDESETIDANAIFGTWQLVLEEGYDDEDDEYYSTDRYTKDRRRYYHIDKDGTCVEYFIRFDEGVNAGWSITNMPNYALDAENKRIRFDSSEWNELITLTSTTMKIKETWDNSWEITTYTKVSDSVLDDIK